ncbi:TELO2-interacting protein 1 [Histomonas meleagridis]|uniref:TELO2-interacting protein 1-like n=1 Tax=Histomonas meleagridis TaxID=135588 RepID=UPI00355ABB98|nr:TELO2-interacting protein 1 [Histomonas meleagridis]KAH0798231.1 TELO2-interacting protein 1-like [Histomonas meleagridis]
MEKSKTDWSRIVDIITEVENAPTSKKAIRELSSYLDEFKTALNSSDQSAFNIISFLFQKSLLPLLGTENLSPTLIEGILLIFEDILSKKIQLSVSQIEASQLICFVLKDGIEHKRELFEEIGNHSFSILIKLIPETIEVKSAAFLISTALEYATKSTVVHGFKSVQYLQKLLQKIQVDQLRSILPGVSVALTTLITPNNNHKIIITSLEILEWLWTTAELNEEDASKLSELIERIFSQNLDNNLSRKSRVSLSGSLLLKRSELLKDSLSPCVRCIFAAVADPDDQVRAEASSIVASLGGSIQISAEFERCINDLKRIARSNDDQKCLSLLQSISGIISINKGKNNDFDSQILTSLNSLTIALLLVSEIKTSDSKICEIDGGFILRRRPYLNSSNHMNSFLSIIHNLPTNEFVEVLIDILSENPTMAPEIFYIFGVLSDSECSDLMMSIIEQPNWWTPKETNPRSVLTLEMALETSSKLFGTSMLQQLLYRVIECLASPYPSVEQTAKAVLKDISPNGDIAQLLMNNVDYITDRLIARLQFVDVSPEVLTVFSAIISVDGDISDLLSHLLPKIYELLDTRDTFSLPILRMFPRVVEKIPSESENIVDRCIHFILCPSISMQCAAFDSIISAIPKFESEEKLLPMIHQMWGPTVLILKTSADCSNSSVRRAVDVLRIALVTARSFVRGRIRELLSTFSELLINNLMKLKENENHNTHASKMMDSLLKLFEVALKDDNIFENLEVEVFMTLLKCFEADVLDEIKQYARICLKELFVASKAFVWALMLEAAGLIPEKIKPTKYLGDVPREVRNYIGRILCGK